MDIFYSVPSSKLLVIFVTILVVISLVGMHVFDITTSNISHTFINNNTSIYTSIISIATALIIAFIVSNEWQAYRKTQESLTKEAGNIYILLKVLEPMKGMEKATSLTKQYLESIITTEFEDMKLGKLKQTNDIMSELQVTINNHKLSGDERELMLYNKVYDALNDAILYRRGRLETYQVGTPKEVWWLLIIGFTMTIVMTWFINGDPFYRSSMTILVSVTYASMLFLAISLDYPFKGEAGLSPLSFNLIWEKVKVDDMLIKTYQDKLKNMKK